MKSNFLRGIFMPLQLLLLFQASLNAQTLNCGTPDIPSADWLATIQQLNGSGQNATVAAGLSSGYRVAVHFYYMRQSNGVPDAAIDPYQLIEDANQYFDGLFQFKICDLRYIDDTQSQFSVLNIGSGGNVSNLNTIISGLNQPNTQNCIRIVYTGAGGLQWGPTVVGGYAYNAVSFSNPAVYIDNTDAKTLAHELGHYFYLNHTFAGGQSQQIVDGATTIFGVPYSCIQLGDNHCLTEADLGVDFCTPSSDCQTVTCTVLDPEGNAYHPDPTLLMSYYAGCYYRFTADQRQTMFIIYSAHPNYAGLRQPPACVLPDKGLVHLNCGDIVGANFLYDPIEGIGVEVSAPNIATCSGASNETDANGNYETLPCTLPTGQRVFRPDVEFGDPLNGVSAFDLVRISQHILGLDPFTSPFQMIAADANNSGSITSFDIVEIRRLILGINITFPTSLNWRYVPDIFVNHPDFADLFYDDNPFDAFVEDPYTGIERYYSNQTTNTWMDFVRLVFPSDIANIDENYSFTGVKVGDVNCSANPEGALLLGPDHTFQIETGANTSLGANSIKKVQFIASGLTKPVAAWQFGVSFDANKVSILNKLPGNTAATFSTENSYFPATPDNASSAPFTALWFSEDNSEIDFQGKVLMQLVVKGNQSISQLENAFQLSKNKLSMKFYAEDGTEIPTAQIIMRVVDTLPGDYRTIEHDHAINKWLFVAPNPFQSQVTFNFVLDHDEVGTIRIADALGKTVYTNTLGFSQGENSISISDLGHLPTGVYWYYLKAGNQISQGKLLKRN